MASCMTAAPVLASATRASQPCASPAAGRIISRSAFKGSRMSFRAQQSTRAMINTACRAVRPRCMRAKRCTHAHVPSSTQAEYYHTLAIRRRMACPDHVSHPRLRCLSLAVHRSSGRQPRARFHRASSVRPGVHGALPIAVQGEALFLSTHTADKITHLSLSLDYISRVLCNTMAP